MILSSARQVPSPHFNQRPANVSINLLVVHNISLPPGEFGGDYVERFFQGELVAAEHPFFQQIEQLKVAAHFFIRRDGEVIQFVDTDDRAWHAGESSWQGVDNCNDYSIGVELEGTDDIPYTQEQYDALASLSLYLMQQYPDITNDRIVGHSDIAPGRKTDPGESFDWELFKKCLTQSKLAQKPRDSL